MMILRKIRNGLSHYIDTLLFKKIGYHSYVKNPIIIMGGKFISIGDNSKILDGARIEAEEKYGDAKYYPSIQIGNNVEIGQYLHMTCAEKIKIGNNCMILPGVLITDINHEYKDIDTPPYLQGIEVSPVSIDEDCMIGMGARILPGVQLGKHCIVGTNAVVLKGSYDDYSVLVGVPARIVKRFNPQTQEWEEC